MGDIRTSANSSFRDFETAGVPASGDHEPIKSSIRATFGVVEDAVDTAQATATAAATGLSWVTSVRVRSTGNVVIASALENGDTLNGVTLATADRVFLGSQTAPAENGIYVVPASGAASRATDADAAAELARIAFVVRDGTVGAGERWTLPLASSAITVGTTALNFVQVGVELDYAADFTTRLEAVELPLRVFRSTVTDPLLVNTVVEAHVIGAWASEDFYLNVQFYDYGGGPYNKWVKFNLHDATTNSVVAAWSKINVDPGTESEWVFLTNAIQGGPVSPYQGIVAALRIDWAAATALGWNDFLTTHVTVAAAGVREELNRPPEALLSFLDNMEPAETIIVKASGGDYTTVNAAVEALWIDDGTTISRSTFPNSDRASPARLVQIRAVEATLDEAVTPRTISSISNGLVLPAWAELYIPKGGRLKIASGDAPVIEMNMPGRIRGGGTIENLGIGYCLHIDNSLPQRAENGPAILRYFGVHLIEDMNFIAHGTTGVPLCVGGAVNNGMRVVFRRCSFDRGAGTAVLVAFHTTPGTTDAGEIGFENCYFNPAYEAVQFIKSHTTPTGLRHKIWFRDCEGGAIQYADPTVIGGTVPFVRSGTIGGFSSVSASLDP